MSAVGQTTNTLELKREVLETEYKRYYTQLIRAKEAILQAEKYKPDASISKEELALIATRAEANKAKALLDINLYQSHLEAVSELLKNIP